VLGVAVISINVIFVIFVGFVFAQAWSKRNKMNERFSTFSNWTSKKRSREVEIPAIMEVVVSNEIKSQVNDSDNRKVDTDEETSEDIWI